MAFINRARGILLAGFVFAASSLTQAEAAPQDAIIPDFTPPRFFPDSCAFGQFDLKSIIRGVYVVTQQYEKDGNQYKKGDVLFDLYDGTKRYVFRDNKIVLPSGLPAIDVPQDVQNMIRYWSQQLPGRCFPVIGQNGSSPIRQLEQHNLLSLAHT